MVMTTNNVNLIDGGTTMAKFSEPEVLIITSKVEDAVRVLEHGSDLAKSFKAGGKVKVSGADKMELLCRGLAERPKEKKGN